MIKYTFDRGFSSAQQHILSKICDSILSKMNGNVRVQIHFVWSHDETHERESFFERDDDGKNMLYIGPRFLTDYFPTRGDSPRYFEIVKSLIKSLASLEGDVEEPFKIQDIFERVCLTRYREN